MNVFKPVIKTEEDENGDIIALEKDQWYADEAVGERLTNHYSVAFGISVMFLMMGALAYFS